MYGDIQSIIHYVEVVTNLCVCVHCQAVIHRVYILLLKVYV